MKKTISVYDPFRKQIPIETIKYVEGHGNYSKLHLTKSKPVLISRTLSKVADQLPSFVRIYKKYLVNPRFIEPKQPLSAKNLTLTLATGEVLPVSRRRVAELIPLLSTAKV